MIVRKTWERYVQKGGITTYRDVYTGWFLFGIIPLFVNRERKRVS